MAIKRPTLPTDRQIADETGRLTDPYWLYLDSIQRNIRDGAGASPGALTISFSGSQGQQGVVFSAALVATGGTQPYTFSITVGSLPTGLTLNASTGRISGTPTVAGPITFTARVTDSAATTADLSCTVNIALPTGASTLVAVATAVGRDVGHATDTADPVSRLVSFRVGCTCTFATAPLEYVTVYLSKDGGSNWYWINYFQFTASGQEVTFLTLRPSVNTTWKVAAVAGTIPGDGLATIATASLPAGRQISAGFTALALTLPSATLGTTPTPAAGAGGNWPYNKTTGDGSQYYSISALNITVSSAYLDPNVFTLNTTFQDLDASHNPIGPEHIYGGVVPINGTINIGQLDGDYGTDGFSYIRTGNIAYVRWKIYASNRVDQTTAAWANPAASTLQTDPGSGAGYVDILVAAGGALPPGRVLQLGHGVQFDQYGHVIIPNQNSGASIIEDASFQYSTAGVLGSGGLAPGWSWGLGRSSTVEIKTDGGNSDANYARLTGGDASVTQTISVQAGLRFYVQVAARSSNTAGAAHALGIYIDWLDQNRASLLPYTTAVGIVTGYVAAWTNPAVSGYLTAPTGAAWAIVKVSTAMAEPGYWDIDDLLVQPVISQQANSVTASTGQAATGYGTSVFAIQAAVAAADYGLDYARLIAPGATVQTMLIQPNSLATTMASGSGGINFIQVGRSDNTYLISLTVDDGIGPIISIHTGGTTYTGINSTIQDNLGVNHTVKCGLLVT